MKPKADKSLGQHFLKNKEVITNICDQKLIDYDMILEIGPGPATLTQNLADKKKTLVLVEKDIRFKEILENVQPMPTLLFEDALQFDLRNYHPAQDKNVWLVSNLPYNISAPLLINFLQWPQVKAMTLMFQKEVGEKTLPQEKINSLFCLTNTYFQPELLIRLKPGAFHPPPEVHSVVINYTRNTNPLVPVEEFSQLETHVRQLFAQRRKQLVGSLKSFHSKEKLQDFLQNHDLSPTIRAEDLKLAQVIALYQWLKL